MSISSAPHVTINVVFLEILLKKNMIEIFSATLVLKITLHTQRERGRERLRASTFILIVFIVFQFSEPHILLNQTHPLSRVLLSESQTEGVCCKA